MKLALKQKKIITISKNILIKNKHKAIALNFFALWVDIPGTIYLKFKVHGFKYFLKFITTYIKHILSIGHNLNYEITKAKKNKTKYCKVIISWAFKKNFKNDGSYHDKYLNINSKRNQKILWFLIYMDKEKPKKINKNIILFSTKKSLLNFDFLGLFYYLLKTLYKSSFSPKKFIYKITSFSSFSEAFQNNFIANIQIKRIKKILMIYEGQPFQKEITEILKKINKNIKIIGYDSVAPLALPLNFNHSIHCPDVLLTNGSSQSNFYSKYLNWPRKKIKVVPSLRFKNIKKKNFKNNIFLPYKIDNEKIILNEFIFLVTSGKINNIKKFNIKNHPARHDSKNHKKLMIKMREILKENYDKKNTLNRANESAIIIGQTTAVTLAIETGITSYHICLDPIFDSYTKELWKNIKIDQLSKHTFKYELIKKNSLVMIKKEKKLFEKYYDV